MTKAFLYGLYAVRAGVDSLIAQAEEAMGISGGRQPGSCPACKASEDKQEDASTMGTRAMRCTVCRTEYAPSEAVTG